MGKNQLFGNAGADQLHDQECDGQTLSNGSGGNDYLESWTSRYEGLRQFPCTDVADKIVGSSGIDTADVNEVDSVSTVEHVTRITEPTP